MFRFISQTRELFGPTVRLSRRHQPATDWLAVLAFGMIVPAPLATAFATETLSGPQPTSARPHIVLMMADDLGWGDVGYQGSRIATPHIDGLAKRGTRLVQYYAQPVCSPTRGALLTGRYPMRLGLQCGVVRPWARHGLPLKERTLPQALGEAGYATAIVGKWHLGHATAEFLPTRRGFDQQYGHYNGALDYFTHIRDGGFDWHRNDRTNRDEGYTTDLIGAEAARVIAQHDRTRPLFLYVPFNAPHTPLQAPPKYIERYAAMPDERRRTFAAMVTCMDDAVGTIVAALDEHGYAANTLIIFCSDNGGIPRLGSNGKLRAGKGTLYEGGVRVPGVLVWKGKVKPGSQVNHPLHVVDWYPTLVKLAGAQVRQANPGGARTGRVEHNTIDGRDIWPTITRGVPRDPNELLFNVTPFHGALRQGPWKLIHNGKIASNAIRGISQETWELFNLDDDPWERNNLFDLRPEIADRLKRRLAEYAAQAVKPNIPPNRPPAGFQAPKVWGEFPLSRAGEATD